jgi:hypothetical protein
MPKDYFEVMCFFHSFGAHVARTYTRDGHDGGNDYVGYDLYTFWFDIRVTSFEFFHTFRAPEAGRQTPAGDGHDGGNEYVQFRFDLSSSILHLRFMCFM